MKLDNYGFHETQVTDLMRLVADLFSKSGGASATWDPASVAAGAQSAATTLTVTGARAGDDVAVWHTSNLLGGVLVASVTANDTVSVQLLNPTAGAIDVTTGTLQVKVFNKTSV